MMTLDTPAARVALTVILVVACGATEGNKGRAETPAPETPAPETPAPETPAPETPAPETPAPETPAPETPAPETPAPIHLGHCSDRKGKATFPLDPAVRESIEGSNGTFAEACDDEGNLIAYACDMQIICGGTLDCAPFPTGEVSPVTYDCEGRCQVGTCTE